MRSHLVSLCALFLTGACSVSAHAANCAALARLSLSNTAEVRAEAVPAGSFAPPDGSSPVQIPAFCRVSGVLEPSSDSRIRFEIWLPQEHWNHEFLGVGNGGFAGSIYYSQLAGNLKRGFATAGSDAGHQADAEDASWAYRHPEKIKDFGYRATHLTAQLGQMLTARYYGIAPKKDYFDSCSDGGREALMEAQRYPEDYNGILAGAPANNWTRLVTGGLALNQIMLRNPASYISSQKLPAITKAVLAQCDAQDGLKDGILNDPRTCHFHPETLLCKGADSLNCLTAPQVGFLRAIYTGAKDSHGRLIFPGLMPGDEAGAWKSWVVGDGPGANLYAANYFRYMVYNDPTWNPLTADADKALNDADAQTAQALDAKDPDLSQFAARGGKLILYHGWNDPAISPLNTIAYYKSVQAKLGAAETANFVRLYMVPGMGHCTGGPGATAFGQFGLTTAKGPTYGIFAALAAWENQGTAPTAVIATKYGATGKVMLTRPLCPYPQIAKYNGSGNPDAAASFTCQVAGEPSASEEPTRADQP